MSRELAIWGLAEAPPLLSSQAPDSPRPLALDIDCQCNPLQAGAAIWDGFGMDDAGARIAGGPVLDERVVRYADLRPCFNAFVDTRTPGSEAKENFTIIGPGVSENPDQYVHITEPHGYNIGAARQPPHCVNSQHSHNTAEVFVVHTGRWRFDLGEHGDEAQVFAGPGDVISLPTGVFRGFTNVGQEVGFLWAVLGGDDPGRVTWAPEVFRLARNYGLILMENGLLVDTTAGQEPPSDIQPLAPTTPVEAAAMKHLTQAEAERLVVSSSNHAREGTQEIIGPDGPISWPHGFTLARRVLAAGGRTEPRTDDRNVVLFVHEGSTRITQAAETTELCAGDTMTVKRGARWWQISETGAVVFEVQKARAGSG